MQKNMPSISNSKKNNNQHLFIDTHFAGRNSDTHPSLNLGKNNGYWPGESTMLIGCRETLVRDRARGLVGYDVALTRRRSPVRIRPGPYFFLGKSVLMHKVFKKLLSLRSLEYNLSVPSPSD
jgi:hypothetical protein